MLLSFDLLFLRTLYSFGCNCLRLVCITLCLVSLALLQWAKDERLESVLSEPGKPWQNGTNESFNGKFRDECLAMEWFCNRLEAKVIIQDWRRHYNEIRPHSS